MKDSATHGTATRSNADLDEGEWTPLLEDLLRGLTDATNNRITSLSALAELASYDDDSFDLAMLRKEITRMHDVSALVGILVSRSEDTEALEVGGVLDVAMTIHSHHPRLRPVPCSIEKVNAVLPVRVPRWALLRLALLMIDSAKRTAAATNAGFVVLRLSGDDTFVWTHCLSAEPPGADALRLASLCGGALRHGDGESVLELPSLLEVRRREAASPGVDEREASGTRRQT
jgi:hypothetical protein